jgi:hypothetical protein
MSAEAAVTPGSPGPLVPLLPRTAEWERKHLRLLNWLTVALLAVGVLWRVTRYLLRFPVWGDEAMLLLNYLDSNYLDLVGEVHNGQVAPLLFHWAEMAAIRWLGTSEWAVRLVPFLAGLVSLLLFVRLAGVVSSPLARTLAAGILAVAVWPVSMGTLAKPYATDLLCALLLLVPAAHWLRRPDRLGWLVVLALLAPFCVLGSYPMVFVAGGVAVALLPTAWRHPRHAARVLYATYGLLLVVGFFVCYRLVVSGHMSSAVNGTSTLNGMQLYWSEGFPPTDPLRFLGWLVWAHTGQMVAYPVGDRFPGSLGTALLCTAGLWVCWRQRRRSLLLLLAAPFALGLVAAMLHRYPYGTACRLSQHLAPAVCVLAGLGAAALLLRAPERLRSRLTLAVAGVLLLIGAGGLTRDLLRPYRDSDSRWARALADDLVRQAGPDGAVLAIEYPEPMTAVLQWNLRTKGERVAWAGVWGHSEVVARADRLWVVCVGDPARAQAVVERLLTYGGRSWAMCGWRTATTYPEHVRPWTRTIHGHISCWVCTDAPGVVAR